MPATLQADALLPALAPWRDAPRWWLGLSGGLDSTVLLDLLVQLGQQQGLPPLQAIHIDHQLQDSAPRWRRHCEQLCADLSVPLTSRQVSVADLGEGLEAAARAARYQVFEELLGAGELLLLAHHLDDQVETFFLRLMRGAGPLGLAGMPASRPLGRGALLRPLLATQRAAMHAHARARQLIWQEDASNHNTDFDRNFLRQQVLPLLATRWPGYRQSVDRSQQALADIERELAGVEYPRLQRAAGERGGDAFLSLSALGNPSVAELARLLRRWLQDQGCRVVAADRLREFARQLLQAKPDSQPGLDGDGYSLRRYRDAVYLLPAAVAPLQPGFLTPDAALVVPGLGELSVAPVAGVGLALPPEGGWALRWRQGGERCKPLGRASSQSLKKLLQEAGVPPWQRDRLPLLYAGDALVAVADQWICAGGEAASDAVAYRVCWRPGTASAALTD